MSNRSYRQSEPLLAAPPRGRRSASTSTTRPARRGRPQAAAATKATIKKSDVPKPTKDKALTANQICKAIAGKMALSGNEMTAKDVGLVFECYSELVQDHIKPRGPGHITLPGGLAKIMVHRKKATKARMGRNPATGEEIKIAAKPARKVIKVRALKKLKEMIE